MSFVEQIQRRRGELAARDADPWRAPLERLRGRTDYYDRIERVSSQSIFDFLEVPQRSRGAGAGRRLAKLMRELGWSPIRVRDLNRSGFREQIRGYARDARHTLAR